MFANLTNHPLSSWSAAQMAAARALNHGEPFDLGENDDERDDLSAYVKVRVSIDNRPSEVWCMVGVPADMHGTVRAGGRVEPSAWFESPYDYCRVQYNGNRSDMLDDLIDALAEAAPRLWREVLEMRRRMPQMGAPTDE